MLQNLQGKGLLIHHWDTDGICSAQLLIKHLKNKNIDNKTPNLGNYYLTPEELKTYQHFDYIIIADMSLPEHNILALAQHSQIMIFDHHLGKPIPQVFHNNPIIKGHNPDHYPSASWIVNDYLKQPPNLYALLGIIGDHEQKIKQNTTINQHITTYCTQHNLTFNDLLQMVYLIDSNYKIGDKKAVEQAPQTLLTYTTPQQILTNITWKNNTTKLQQEIQTILQQPHEEHNQTIIKKINTTYNIISTITRQIAWNTGKNTIVINEGFFPDKDQLYVRSKKNIEPMIQKGKNQGLKCGGKKEVLGAILPKQQTYQFLQEIITFIQKP